MSANYEDIKEKLAAIEHERWADWQRWVHKCLIPTTDGKALVLPTKIYNAWNRQIATSYEMLSDKEKASDMEQVDRYWPLIEAHIKQIEVEATQRCLEFQLPWPKDVFGEVPEGDWAKIDEFAKKELGYPVDRISGDLMRHGWKCLERSIREYMNDLAELKTQKENK